MRGRGFTLTWAILAVALVLSMAGPALAQSGTGTISGLVKDPTGSVVPGVAVSATNRGTNIVTTAVTNPNGLYSLRNLPIGTYAVSFTIQGFRPHTRDGIEVRLGSAITLDQTLEVGGIEDAVTVTADASLLQTGNAEIGTSLTSTVVKDLPLDVSGGRSILIFAYAVTPSVEGSQRNNTWNSHVAGGADFTNEVVLDGTSAVVQIGGWVGESSPPMEAVDEFKVQTSGIAAEYGRTAGGVFNFSLKSGTNNIHGSVLGTMHNEALNANTWQNNYLRALNPGNPSYERASDRQYDGAFSLGGPIVKDKTFFFVAGEYYTQKRFTLGAANRTVPMPAFLDGDFSALLNTSGAPLGLDKAGNPIYPGAIRDPLTGNVFPGNVIPQGRFSNVSRQIVDIYRGGYLPQVDRLTNNSSGTLYNNPYQGQQQISAKLTHQFSQKSQLSGSFIYTRRPRTLADAGGIWDPSDPAQTGGPLSKGRTQTVNSQQARLSHSYTFGSNLLNVANVSWSTYNNPSLAGSADGGWPTKLGFGDTGAGNFPQVGFGAAVNGVGTTGIGYSNNAGYKSYALILADSLSWVKGRHAFKFGGEWRDMQTASYTATGTLNFNFDPAQTQFIGQPWSNKTGFGFASFLLGGTNGADQQTPGDLTGSRDYFALYAQDDYRISDKLTVNLGLRWETTGPWSEKDGHWGNYNTTAINPTFGVPGLLEFAQDGSTAFEGPRDWKQFGPRVGMTYQLSPRAVIRAAYGLFYQGIGMDYWAGTPYAFAPGFRATNRVAPVGNGVAAFNWDSGYPGAEIPGTKDPNSIPWGPTSMSPESLKGGRVHQWNAGVDFELTRDLAFGLNYIGNTGSSLHSGNLERNQPDMQGLGNVLKAGKEWNWVSDPASAAAAGVPFPYPGFANFAQFAVTPFPEVAELYGPIYYVGSPLGSQTYHALQVTLNKRRSHGVSGQVSYAFSRARGNMQTGFEETWSSGYVQDVNNLGMESGVIAPYDRTHVFKGYVNLELPFGKGRRFMDKGGLANALLGGWDVSLIFWYGSGSPLAITSNASYAGWSGYPIYVNRDPNVSLNSQFDPGQYDQSNQNSPNNRYFDPKAFSNPAYGEFGKGPGRFEELRSFGAAYEDLGLMKGFSVGRVRAQLRLELLNLFNRHYFSDPITNIGSPQFGQVISTSGSPRTGQVSVRLDW